MRYQTIGYDDYGDYDDVGAAVRGAPVRGAKGLTLARPAIVPRLNTGRPAVATEGRGYLPLGSAELTAASPTGQLSSVAQEAMGPSRLVLVEGRSSNISESTVAVVTAFSIGIQPVAASIANTPVGQFAPDAVGVPIRGMAIGPGITVTVALGVVGPVIPAAPDQITIVGSLVGATVV